MQRSLLARMLLYSLIFHLFACFLFVILIQSPEEEKEPLLTWIVQEEEASSSSINKENRRHTPFSFFLQQKIPSLEQPDLWPAMVVPWSVATEEKLRLLPESITSDFIED